MKTIGLIGGMSWNSALEYYPLINSLVVKKPLRIRPTDLGIPVLDTTRFTPKLPLG